MLATIQESPPTPHPHLGTPPRGGTRPVRAAPSCLRTMLGWEVARGYKLVGATGRRHRRRVALATRHCCSRRHGVALGAVAAGGTLGAAAATSTQAVSDAATQRPEAGARLAAADSLDSLRQGNHLGAAQSEGRVRVVMCGGLRRRRVGERRARCDGPPSAAGGSMRVRCDVDGRHAHARRRTHVQAGTHARVAEGADKVCLH